MTRRHACTGELCVMPLPDRLYVSACCVRCKNSAIEVAAAGRCDIVLVRAGSTVRILAPDTIWEARNTGAPPGELREEIEEKIARSAIGFDGVKLSDASLKLEGDDILVLATWPYFRELANCRSLGVVDIYNYIGKNAIENVGTGGCIIIRFQTS